MAKKKASPAGEGDAAMAEPAEKKSRKRKLQAYVSASTKRSSLHFHETNPRYIDRHAAKKLRESLKKNGLVEPIVVNKRTVANGFPESQDGMLTIVGGHQRTKAADEIYNWPDGGDDYDVPIALIEVPHGRELELLVSLNNPSIQGMWDADLLEAVLADPDIEVANTGFERADLAHLLDDGMLDGLFGAAGAAQAAAEAPIVDALNEIRGVSQQFEKAVEADRESSGDGGALSPAGPDPDNMRQLLVDRRKAFIDKQQDNNATEFMLVFIAENEPQLARFLYAADLPMDNRYLPLSILADKLGVSLDEPEPIA